MIYTVEHDIEIPKANREGNPKYPFDNMNVGDSFLISDVTEETLRKRQRSVIASAYDRGYRVSTRTIRKPNRKLVGIRVWLVGKI